MTVFNGIGLGIVPGLTESLRLIWILLRLAPPALNSITVGGW